MGRPGIMMLNFTLGQNCLATPGLRRRMGKQYHFSWDVWCLDRGLGVFHLSWAIHYIVTCFTFDTITNDELSLHNMRTRQLWIINIILVFVWTFLSKYELNCLNFSCKVWVKLLSDPRAEQWRLEDGPLDLLTSVFPQWTRPEDPEHGPVLIFIFMLNKEFSV